MIAYTTVGTTDLSRAAGFYDALFSELGAKRLLENERLIAWGTGMDAPMFLVCIPWDDKQASPGNGQMVSLAMPSKQAVNELHAKAISLGASDEGEPGPRGAGFYLAYFRDLDGNKLACFHPNIG